MELNLAPDPEASYLLWCAILSPSLLIYLGVFNPLSCLLFLSPCSPPGGRRGVRV